MRTNANVSRLPRGKGRLLASGAVAAGIAALACGGTAGAQVAANPVYVEVGGGTSSSSNPGTNTTIVTVTQSQNIINWVPTDTAATGGAIDILPATHVWEFNGEGDYLVFNRFTNGAGLPLSRQIAINGTVNSYDTLTSARGGSIWFYNAGGLLISNGAAINVGSLVLTTSDIDATNGLMDGGGTTHFHAATPGTSGVTIAPGAIIDVANTNPGGAYMAVVSPRIRQSGTVRIDGSVAYVAAEEAAIRINNGLFDIDVVLGADGGVALVHDGSTTGPAHQQGDTDQSRIYMIAIPKNDAVSMLVSGQIGYDDALIAQADPDGTVILSGGYGIVGGESADTPNNAVAADISIANAIFRSNTEIHASGTLAGAPTGSASSPGSPTEGQIYVEGNALFRGDAGAMLSVGADHIVHADGDLVIESRGGTAAVRVNGGQFTVGGDLIVSADAFGESSINSDGGNGQGGTATIRLAGGTIAADRIIASASGFGGAGSAGDDDDPLAIDPGGNGGAGRGGTAAVIIEGGADVTATAGIAAFAIGEGGVGGDFFNISSGGAPGTPGGGGEGRGGSASVTVDLNGGSVTAAGVTVDASGAGGDGGKSLFSGSGAATGIGIGGSGGDGRGGSATIRFNAPVATSSQMEVVAQGLGGDGGSHNVGGDGGDAYGGIAQAIVTGFDAGSHFAHLHAGAFGGDGGIGVDGAGGDGGSAVGGTARAQAGSMGGRIVVTANDFNTQGIGGDGGGAGLSFMAANVAVAPSGGRGGDGTGGTMEAGASQGAALFIDPENAPPTAVLGSAGRGGDGGAGAGNISGSGVGGNGGDSGAGFGGTVRLVANGGTVSRSSGALLISATGIAGETGVAGDGPDGMGTRGAGSATTGGRVLIEANNSPAAAGLVELGAATIEANGDAAGRVVFQGNGAIRAAALDVRTRGAAAPTNGNVDLASAGIFLAPTGSGSITTTGTMRLESDGSIGIHSQAGATIETGGPMTLTAGDQVDIRHTSRTGTAATIQAGDLTISAGTNISAAPGSRLAAANGPSAANITISTPGAASIDHAEATGDFTAHAASFRTGPNSIITGGDILIAAPGAVDLGNSSAGGFVSVQGGSILFASIAAGASVGLNASGPDGIAGESIDAGGDIWLTANRIVLTGPVTGDASLSIQIGGGGAAIDLADVAGNIIIDADGDITGDYIAGGDIRFRSGADIAASAVAKGGYVNANGVAGEGHLFASAAGDIMLAKASAAHMVGVSAGQAASIASGSAGEDLLLIGGTTASLTDFTAGDDIRVEAAGDIVARNVRTTGAGTDSAYIVLSPSSDFAVIRAAADGANIVLTSTGGAIDGADVSAAGRLSGEAAADITGGAFAAVGDLSLTAGDAIGVDHVQGGTVALSGLTGVTAASVASLGATTLLSGKGAVAIDELSSVGSVIAIADSILIRDGGDLNFARLVAETGDATVHGSGNLTIVSGQVAGTADLDSDGDALTVTSLTATDAVLTATGGAMTLGDVAATNDLAATASTGLSIVGGVRGRTISLTSRDIAVRPGAGVGSVGGTGRLSIANGNDTGPTFVGGTGDRAGYHLDADELTRLFGADIRITGPGSGTAIGSAVAPDMIVEDFVMTSSNLGPDGSLSLATPGKMRVTGSVRLEDMTDANRLTLHAEGALEVILGQGAIRLANGDAPAGRLDLVSGEIIVATPDAIDAVAAATGTRAIEARLARNDGVISDAGALFAGGINAAVDRGFYVQNSGTGAAPAVRRGLSFGAQGLNVDAANPDVRIVVNGVQMGSTGLVTGRNALALLTVNGAAPVSGLFDGGSTFNGCLIINPAACGVAAEFPVQNVIEEKDGIEGDDGEGNIPPAPLITLRGIDPLTGEPLVDDPVTGAGNDDLWAPPGE